MEYSFEPELIFMEDNIFLASILEGEIKCLANGIIVEQW